jgi:hypothetical protein
VKDGGVGAMVEEAMGGLWCCFFERFSLLLFLRQMQSPVCFLSEQEAAPRRPQTSGGAHTPGLLRGTQRPKTGCPYS